MFRTDLLPIIMSLDTVFTAIGVCHTEILKWIKLLVSLNCKTYVVSKIICYIKSFNVVKVFQKMQ